MFVPFGYNRKSLTDPPYVVVLLCTNTATSFRKEMLILARSINTHRTLIIFSWERIKKLHNLAMEGGISSKFRKQLLCASRSEDNHFKILIQCNTYVDHFC